MESVRSTLALLIAPLGPLAAGVLLGAVSARATVAVFAGLGLVLALWGTLSPAIRAGAALPARRADRQASVRSSWAASVASASRSS